MPTHSTLVTLEGLFTCEGDSHARCPVTTWALIHGNREYTVHYSHFVPKSEQSSLVAIELDDNVSNIMPTVEIIHTNMELLHRTPNLSFKFHSSLNDQYDQYTVVLNSGLSMNHALRTAVGSCAHLWMCIIECSVLTMAFTGAHLHASRSPQILPGSTRFKLTSCSD